MPDKKANHFANAYPTRFSICFKQQEDKMPQLPQEKKALPNGAHILIALDVETTKGMYGEQEEVTCMLENSPETLTRVWVTHKTLAQIKAAAAAGLVCIDEANGSWEVVIGARFQVFVAGGKVVGVSAPPAPAPITAGQ